MHILFMTEYLPHQTHGIAIRVHHQVTHLRKLGHTVHVAGPEHGPLTTIPLFVTPFHVFNPEVKISTLHPSSVASVLAIVRDLDVVHMFCPANPTFYVLLPVFCACNVPVVCSHHCDPSQFSSLLGPAKPMALKFMLPKRRFSKTEQKVGRVFSKTEQKVGRIFSRFFAMVSSPTRVLTPSQSTSKRHARPFVLSSKIFVRGS